MQLRIFRHHNPAQTYRPLLDSFYCGERYFGCSCMDVIIKVRKRFLKGDMILMPNVKHFLGVIVAYGLSALVTLLAMPACMEAQTASQTMQANISPLGLLYNFSNSVALSKAGTVFNTFTGSLTFNYRARTTKSTGAGSITVKATADFSPAGGPSIGTPPTTGDKLTYTCSSASLGTPCSGTQTVSLTTAATVLTIPATSCTGGGGTCSGSDPNTGTVNFLLTNDPKYKTGSYSATLTFTISAS